MTCQSLPSSRCGCGLYSLAGVAEITVDDVTHRPGRPCGATPARPAPERAGRAGDQPLPLPGAGEDILLVLSRRILERRATGVRRYGRPLQAFNGRAAALDLEDEMLDGAAYARQVGLELDRLEKAVVALSRRLRGADAEFGSVEAALELAELVEARVARGSGWYGVVMGICQGPECDRETERRYCDAHWKQVQRGGPLTPLAQPTSPLEALILAASDLAEVDAEDDAEFRRAKERAEAASLRLARALGWRPPVPRKPSPCCCHVIQLALPLKTRHPRAVHGRAYPVT